MTIMLLDKKLVLIFLISFLNFSCVKIGDVPNIFGHNIVITNSVTQPSSLPLISIDNNGNGLVIWSGSGKSIKNFIPVEDEFFIANDFVDPVIKLNTNGDGLITWHNKNQSIDGFPLINHAMKIIAYKPSGKDQVLSEKIPTNLFKLNDKGDGVIYWRGGKNLVNFVEIKNLNISEEVSSYKRTYENSLIYAIGTQISEIDVAKYSEFYDTKLDQQGNGFYTIKENNEYYAKIINKYKATDKKISLGVFNLLNSVQVCIDEQGNGFAARENKGNLIMDKISNFTINYNSQYITTDSKPKSTPVITVNENGNGYLAWYENSILKARFINRYNLQ